MAFSEAELRNIEKSISRICDSVPEHVREQLRHEYTITDYTIIMDEVRPYRMEPGKFTRLPFAQFRFVRSSSLWKLYWMRATEKWQIYEPHPESTSLDDLVDTVLADQMNCFFG